MIEKDISCEVWREYDIPGRELPYRIDAPVKLFMREGGSTHRVVDSKNVVHCVPAPGNGGCILRWVSSDPAVPVHF